jgi:hypothetical protein
MVTPRKDEVSVALSTLAAGLRKHAPRERFVVHEKKYTTAQLARRIDALVASGDEVLRLRGLLERALTRDRALRAKEAPILAALRDLLRARYGAMTLQDMALRRRKPRRAETVEELATRVDKMRATRNARHTGGKRQKAKIKGVVPT